MKTIGKWSGLAMLTAASILAGCSQQKSPTEYTIQGTLKGIDSGMVKLVRTNDSNRTSTTLDSMALSNGSFELKGQMERPEMMRLVFEPGNWGMSLFVENSAITVEADTTGAQYFDWTAYGGDKGAQLKTFTVSGSESQNQYAAYENHPENRRYLDAFAQINERYEKAAEADKEAIRSEGDSLRQLKDIWELNYIDSAIQANPSSVVSAYLFRNYYQFHEDMSLDTLKATLALFQGNAKASPYFDLVNKELELRTAVSPGQIAPDFTALKTDSSEFKLSSTRGNYVLIDFWASWCAPCRASIPHWKEVYAQYHDKGFEIVGVTNDSKRSDWLKALEEENMPWIQVTDDFPIKNMPARIATQYVIPYLPTYVLLDPDGKVIFHNASKEEITEELKKRLG